MYCLTGGAHKAAAPAHGPQGDGGASAAARGCASPICAASVQEVQAAATAGAAAARRTAAEAAAAGAGGFLGFSSQG